MSVGPPQKGTPPSPKTLINNALLFLLLVVVFGLLNIAFLYGAGKLSEDVVGQPMPNASEAGLVDLFADGGLFFFAIAVSGSSLYTVLTYHDTEHISKDLRNFVILVFIMILVPSLFFCVANDMSYYRKGKFSPPISGLLSWEEIAALASVALALWVNFRVDYRRPVQPAVAQEGVVSLPEP